MSLCNIGSVPVVGSGKRDKIVICKRCEKPEYWGEMRWLSGECTCRNCYREKWEKETGKVYMWDDLDGPRPTEEEYNIQEKEE